MLMIIRLYWNENDCYLIVYEISIVVTLMFLLYFDTLRFAFWSAPVAKIIIFNIEFCKSNT